MDTDVVLQFQHMQMTLRLLSNVTELLTSLHKSLAVTITAFGLIQNLSNLRCPLNNC